MKIVLIGGKARVGKDTFADYLYEELEKNGKKPVKMQISQYIKYYAIKYFDWDGEEETKPRELLQHLGTEIIRNKIDKYFHIDRLIQDIRVLSYYYDYFIISDVRLEEEIEKPKKEFNDVVSIKIERENDVLTKKEQSHITEIGLDNYNDFDYIIENNGTIEELKNKAIDLLKEMGDIK